MVLRPVLFERLSAPAPGTVTLVCAPAGSGKTVLLRSWAAETDEAVAWVTVERGERDSQRFCLQVIDALADAAGDDVIERISPAPGFAGAAVVERRLQRLFPCPVTDRKYQAMLTLSETALTRIKDVTITLGDRHS